MAGGGNSMHLQRRTSFHSFSEASDDELESGDITPCSNLGRPAFANWAPKLPMSDIMELLRSDREQLPSLMENIDEQVGEVRKLSGRPIDMRRVEILNRILELLTEHSSSTVGVLQSTILSMFVKTYILHANAHFYDPDEIDQGCCCNPTQSMYSAIEYGVDDRLVVTSETFALMLDGVPNYELAKILDKYTEYVQAMEVAWQVTALEKTCEPPPRIKNASGIAIWGEFMYVADSEQHCIFRVNINTDEIMPFCGTRGKPGPHDGPREMAKFNSPNGLAICECTSTLFVCDTGNDTIRAVNIPSGVVQTVPIHPAEADVRLETPIGICIVRGEYEYEKEASDDEDDDNDDVNTLNSDNFQDYEDDDDDDGLGRHGPLLEGITEEDEELGVDSRRESQQFDQLKVQPGHKGSARYALGNDETPLGNAKTLASITLGRNFGVGSFGVGGGFSRRTSAHTSRRTSGYVSSLTSRRTSGYTSIASSLSSRRTSTHFSMTPGESAKDSLRECTEEDDDVGISLAVTGDHCVYLIKPDKAELVVLAGSPTEYGYKDHDKGKDARFSSMKGIACIRNSLFVADYWNNAIRCINLKTRQVDSVIDFNPCGPIALTVSSSGSVYVLDSECLSVCNILKICSVQCSNANEEGALGTTMFKMIQDSVGSRRGSMQEGLLENLQGRGSARASRRASMESDQGGSRRASLEAPDFWGRRRSSGGERGGYVSSLGPRMEQQAKTHLFPPMPKGAAKKMRSPRNSFGMGRHSSGSDNRAFASLPVVPQALRSLVPGASLHPALIQMTLRSRGESEASARVSALTGSQFHVSVVSSVPDDDDFDDGPEFFSFLNPMHETPWKKIPIGSLQNVYQEASAPSGQCSTNTPLTLAYCDAPEGNSTVEGKLGSHQLIIGSEAWPSVLKVLPPRKPAPMPNGRFRAVAVDVDRVLMADSDSNQIFVVNHAKRTKDKIAGCGKAGYLDGPLDVCRMNQPSSIALDPTTHYIYVADSGNHRIRCIDLSTGFMRTVCGNGVKGNLEGAELRLQSLDSPFDLHFMPPGHLLICCADNSVRRLDLKTSQLDTILVGS